MGVLEFADQSEFFANDRWSVQHPVIYDIFFLRFFRFNSFSRYRASLADSYTDRRKKEERKSEIDDLSVLATCRSATSAMLSSTSNGPIAHESTR